MRRWRWLGGVVMAALLLARPRAAAAGAARAMACWSAAVAPAVFPFMALMPLLTCRDAVRAYERLLGPFMRALFNLPGAAASAMVIGLAGGSPAGAIAARRVAAAAGMSQGQLRRLTLATAGFSPAFLIGGIGAAMLGGDGYGWMLLSAQLLTQLTLALLFRRAWGDAGEPVAAAAEDGGGQPVREAVSAVLGICGYMTLFGAMASAAGDFLGGGAAKALLCLLDVPSGALVIASARWSAAEKLLLMSGICGFGGVCVAAQNLGALRGCGIDAGAYIGARVLAAVYSVGYTALLLGLCGEWGRELSRYVCARPLPAAALGAALLTLPVLVRIKKSVF